MNVTKCLWSRTSSPGGLYQGVLLLGHMQDLFLVFFFFFFLRILHIDVQHGCTVESHTIAR